MARTRKDPRHRAREAALQILYQWEIGGRAVEKAAETFFTRQWPDQDDPPDDLRAFATRLAVDTVDHVSDADKLIADSAKRWRPERMAVLDRLVLRLATYELLAEPATPPKVVINEALELARAYSGEEAVRFVNGVLDAVRKELRPDG